MWMLMGFEQVKSDKQPEFYLNLYFDIQNSHRLYHSIHRLNCYCCFQIISLKSFSLFSYQTKNSFFSHFDHQFLTSFLKQEIRKLFVFKALSSSLFHQVLSLVSNTLIKAFLSLCSLFLNLFKESMMLIKKMRVYFQLFLSF